MRTRGSAMRSSAARPARLEDMAAACKALRRICPDMRRIHDLTGDPALRRFPAGFEGLARIVVGQQLSIASAAAIWKRTAGLARPFRAGAVLELGDGDLRGAGLSRGKIRTLRALAETVHSGALDLARLSRADDATIHDVLTSVHGIGPWTADIYIMFCLGRADAWARGDLALAIATERALGLKGRPSPAELAAIAERWRPWRSAAAHVLWAYYPLSNQLPR